MPIWSSPSGATDSLREGDRGTMRPAPAAPALTEPKPGEAMAIRFITPIPFGLAFGGRERLALATLNALRDRGVGAGPLDWWDPGADVHLLHVIGAESGMWEPAALARRRGIPVVVSAVISLGPRLGRQRMWRRFDRWLPMRTSFRYRRDLLHLADVVIAATTTEQLVLESLFGIRSERISVIPNGIDDHFFSC